MVFESREPRSACDLCTPLHGSCLRLVQHLTQPLYKPVASEVQREPNPGQRDKEKEQEEREKLKWGCWERSSLEAHPSGRAQAEGPCSTVPNLAPTQTAALLTQLIAG